MEEKDTTKSFAIVSSQIWSGVKDWFDAMENIDAQTPYSCFGLKPYTADPSMINAHIAAVLGHQQRTDDSQCPRTGQERSRYIKLNAAARILTIPELKSVLDAYLRRREQRQRFWKEQSLPPVGHSLHCLVCDKENPPTARHCGNCGQLLWDICLTCDAISPAAQKCCTACGSHRSDVWRRITKQFDDEHHEALEKWQSQRHEAALAIWFKWASLQDWKRHDLAREATRYWLEHYPLWVECKTHVCQVLEQVEIAGKRGDWRKQLELLEPLPATVLPKPAIELLQHLLSKKRQIVEYQSQLKVALEEKRWKDCARLLDELLRLEPELKWAKKQAEFVRDRLLTEAISYFQQRKWRTAETLLTYVPNSAQNDISRRLIDSCRKLQWLEMYMQNAPNNDPLRKMLLPVAKKHGVELVVSRASVNKGSGEHDCQARNRTLLGIVPEMIRELPSINGVGNEIKELPNLAAFVPAIGLALTVLQPGQAIRPLANRESKTRLPWSLAKHPGAAWGIDLGTWAIKWVRVAAHNGAYCVTHFGHLPLEKASEHPQHDEGFDAAKAQPLLERIKQEISNQGHASEPIVCSLPGHSLVSRFLMLPRVEKQLTTLMQFELKTWLPFPIDEIAWTFHQGISATDENTMPTTLFATRKKLVDQIADQMQSVFPRRRVAVQHAGLAASAVLRSMGFSLARRTNEAYAVLDLGHCQSLLTVVTAERVICRTLVYGGSLVRKSLIKDLKISKNDVEFILHNPQKYRDIVAVALCITNGHLKLLQELNQIFNTLCSENIPTPRKMYLCGNLTSIVGLMTVFLSGKLDWTLGCGSGNGQEHACEEAFV